MDGRAIANGVASLYLQSAVITFCLGFFFGAFVFGALPWIWAVVKPIIHAATG